MEGSEMLLLGPQTLKHAQMCSFFVLPCNTNAHRHSVSSKSGPQRKSGGAAPAKVQSPLLLYWPWAGTSLHQ